MHSSYRPLHRMFPPLVILLAILSAEARAQHIGIGAGIAIPNDKIAQVTTDLIDKGISGGEEHASNGYYVELRGRLGGELGLTGAIGYNKFAESRSTYFDASNRRVDVTTSQVVVPVSLGADMRLSEGFVVPYLTLEATYNYYYRSFDKGEGDLLPEFESKGEPRFGAAVGGGLNFDLAVIDLGIGARLHLANLLNQGASESEVYYLQIGTVAYFGF